LGEIQKQSIKGTIYIGLGTAIGFLTNAVIFPRVLQANQIGLISILLAYSVIFTQIGSLGFNNVTTRMFPYFRNNENRHNGFISVGMLTSLFGFLVVIALFFIVKPLLIQNSADNSLLLSKYIDYVLPMVFFMIFYNLFENYYKVLYNAVIGTFFREFIKRVFILISIFIYYFKVVAFKDYVLLYVIAISLPTLLILFLLLKNGHFSLKSSIAYIKEKTLGKGMFDVALFGLFASTTNIITLQIDRIMIERGLGLADTGIYTTCFYFGALIALPARMITKITSVYIAEAWKNKKWDEIKKINYKSSLNMFVFGLFALIVIWTNIDSVFIFLPKNYISGKYVILLIGLAFLLDMLAGISMIIISISEKYRYNTYSKILFVILLVVTNFIFIPIWGILGAAFASLLSKLIYNFYKYYIMKKSYKIDPYDKNYLLVIAIGLITYFLTYIIPKVDSFYLDFIIRFFVSFIVYTILIYSFNISDDINGLLNKILLRVKKNNKT
jgi:O-antigen/teichoic acid export membrane protein